MLSQAQCTPLQRPIPVVRTAVFRMRFSAVIDSEKYLLVTRKQCLQGTFVLTALCNLKQVR